MVRRAADWCSRDPEGTASVFFHFKGIALELMAPFGDGPMAQKLGQLIEQEGAGLKSLVFSSDSIESDRRRFERCAMAPEAIEPGQSTDIVSKRQRSWKRFRLAGQEGCAVRLFVLERSSDEALQVRDAPPGAVSGIDHLVITSSEAQRALALYGAKLGMPLLADHSFAANQSRLLSFAVGGVRLEVSLRNSSEAQPVADRIWGLTWETQDIELAHRRMQAAGLGISEIRVGMRAGTRVFTVRKGALEIPTLILARNRE